eukprot:TRINITY_DN1023_c0_g2_i5.p1 TRINITY_DN1023_c0_g2~~TRINITY_DN1023_c0_g2_i5.p1  ORF type:complete len:229 (-),score=-10.58 TRINITY_DN1023_c0_g2_i5:594-1280(-)
MQQVTCGREYFSYTKRFLIIITVFMSVFLFDFHYSLQFVKKFCYILYEYANCQDFFNSADFFAKNFELYCILFSMEKNLTYACCFSATHSCIISSQQVITQLLDFALYFQQNQCVRHILKKQKYYSQCLIIRVLDNLNFLISFSGPNAQLGIFWEINSWYLKLSINRMLIIQSYLQKVMAPDSPKNQCSIIQIFLPILQLPNQLLTKVCYKLLIKLKQQNYYIKILLA